MSAKNFKVGDKVVILPVSGYSFANEVGIVKRNDLGDYIIKVFVPSTNYIWSVRTNHVKPYNPVFESKEYLSLFE